jgi:hypothetical protein
LGPVLGPGPDRGSGLDSGLVPVLSLSTVASPGSGPGSGSGSGSGSGLGERPDPDPESGLGSGPKVRCPLLNRVLN